MISKDITATDLRDYYTQLAAVHAQAHTKEYILVHQEIRKHLCKCSSYTEFGINQGATLALPLLCGIKKVTAYDIALTGYNKARHHFESFAKTHSMQLSVHEANTLKCSIEPVDMLYIDTVHTYVHLSKELKLHGDKAQKYIVFHDTTRPDPKMKDAVREFVATHPQWKIITECDESVGFMTIEKT